VNHTSIIVASFLTISAVSIFGLPVAEITISESIVYCFIFFVLLLQLITVAQAFNRSIVIGFHTILLLPSTVIFFHTKSLFSCFSICIIHAGVQGISHESSHTDIFHIFSGVNQSTSFFGYIELIIFFVFK